MKSSETLCKTMIWIHNVHVYVSLIYSNEKKNIVFKHENIMPYDNNILLNHLKKMVFNTCNKWKSNEKKEH